jgi:imidazolonepropionase-like amidohydrolase/ABC-type multidrug transport system permease subunit
VKAARGLGALVRALLWEAARSRTALFWTLAFPLLLLCILASVFGHGNGQAVARLLPGLATSILLAGTLFSVAMRMVSERQTGVLRRYRVTPVSATVVFAAHGISALITQTATFLVVWGAAALLFKLRIAGSPLSLLAAFLLGAVAITPFGLLVGSAASDVKSAPPLNNLIFFPMMFLSGSAIPLAIMPAWARSFARLLPASYLVELLDAVVVRGQSLRASPGPIAVLLVTCAAGLAMNRLLFRWESTEPLRRGSVAIVLGGLGLLFAGAALTAPGLEIARAREARTPNRTAVAAPGTLRVLRGLTVLDGLGGRLEHARVTLRDGRIAEIAPEDDAASPPAGARLDDLAGGFLIPGLIDSHVHLGGSAGIGRAPDEWAPGRQVRDLQACLALGVTGLVSLTDSADDLARLRQDLDAGEMRAPRVFFSGPSLTAPGGHPTELFAFMPGLAGLLTRQITSAEEADRAVAELVGRRVDVVKLVLEAGSPAHPLPRLSEAAFRAAVAAARAAGLLTTVHVGSDADARLAIDAGADGLEHLPQDLSEATLRLLAARHITLTPTLTVLDAGWRVAVVAGQEPLANRWSEPAILASLGGPGSPFAWFGADPQRRERSLHRLDGAAALVERAARLGVRVLAGSDSGNGAAFHGVTLIRELELLATRARLPLDEVLAAATSRAADRLGRRDRGRILPGAVADLVVLGKDPTTDVSAYRDVRAVYLGGQPLDRDRLLESPAGRWRPGPP